MWFIADILERCTAGFAKAFTKVASNEAEETHNTQQRLRIRAQLHSAFASTGQPVAAPVETAEPPQAAAVVAVSVPETSAAAPVVEAVPAAAVVPAMPMGVRGDVVVRWRQAFAEAERRQMPDLLERLRKDKKVRVAELQMICVEVLGERPQHRKKGEHLDILRRHFAPAERARAPLTDEMRLAN